MLLSLDAYRRQLRSTYDAVLAAEATLEEEREDADDSKILRENRRYRQAQERERARRAARWFGS
jgi:hypothetical protein